MRSTPVNNAIERGECFAEEFQVSRKLDEPLIGLFNLGKHVDQLIAPTVQQPRGSIRIARSRQVVGPGHSRFVRVHLHCLINPIQNISTLLPVATHSAI